MEVHLKEAAGQGSPGISSEATSSPIVGVFDSGVGGFTVAGAIARQRPDINLVYFGDSLNMPYGGRPQEQLRRFARSSIEFLIEQGTEILAVGCNASNSVMGQGELHSFGLPVFDLVSSTLETLRGMYSRPNRIALVGTVATVNSRYWERKLCDAFPELELLPVAAPGFVPLIEAPQPDERAIKAAVTKYLSPVCDAGFRTIIHGCTHYPLLERQMLEFCPDLQFINPAECLAERLAYSLQPAKLQAQPGWLKLFSSLPSETFYRVAEQAFGRPVREYTRMYIVNPYED